MPAYFVKLITKKEIAKDTISFYFEKPDDFKFIPGQFVEIYLLKPKYNDEKGLERHFSIASSPNEKELIFATRMRSSAFKNNLKEMVLGEEVKIKGPFGEFTLPEEKNIPLAFIAGGIGITPFRSMIKYIIEENLPYKITLFYSNHRPEESAFLEELQEFEGINRNFKLIATMTQLENSLIPWSGLRGRINSKMIKDNLKDWHEAKYYIAGPPQMVQAIYSILLEMKIGYDQIKEESFGGY